MAGGSAFPVLEFDHLAEFVLISANSKKTREKQRQGSPKDHAIKYIIYPRSRRLGDQLGRTYGSPQWRMKKKKEDLSWGTLPVEPHKGDKGGIIPWELSATVGDGTRKVNRSRCQTK